MITVADINSIVSAALFMVIKMALPVLLTSMSIGLIISIFQTVTSIQEQTLTFVPKVLGVFTMIMLIGNWMLTELSGYITSLWSDFSRYVR
ncbi:flagellar biosynthetic protein FliQ [Butyrivibrio sp. YAB3001]|uniref:flagellar biosynthetic protein FliQ n=1 Tax=Butyrivibrio sp. YAB3001 TaxID=1520812 RepID=UPI0008F671E2|nr:flagellar biosynthetic protein FliQ [Butyrivibrio sp. YAB3001]SFB66834.1 flagellar biosynthetic protein FliQ [Butyrivibrio sp. YAB3001]